MKKIIFSSVLIGCISTFSLFAQSHPGQMDNQSQVDQPKMTTADKWQQSMINKEGWIELGAEWLYLSSNLTPTFVVESINFSIMNATNANLIATNPVVQSINPEYNSGFSAFFRYRGVSDNDLTFNYSYLRNNGKGTLKDEATFTDQGTPEFPNLTKTDHDDKGHLHSHMHLFDLLAGRALPLNHQMLLRLSGGLTFNDFYMTYQQSDIDGSVFFVPETPPNPAFEQRNTFHLYYKERHRFWGLGPKGQIDFEYLMLPRSWSHNLNFAFCSQFAVLYTRDWSSGKIFESNLSEDINNPQFNIFLSNDRDWKKSAKFHFLPNINMDFGLKYRWESSLQDIIFNLAFGYRVYAFWQLEHLFAGKYQTNSSFNFNVPEINLDRDDHLIYGGPYIRFSLAY